MTCRDVRELADSFLSDTLLTETNHEMLRHLDTCPPCRADVDARRRLRVALRSAFDRAPSLQPEPAFPDRLRAQLRVAAIRDRRAARSSRWFAIAAGISLAASLAGGIFLTWTMLPNDPLARDAIGDHRNCALKFRLVRTPVPIEEAAQRFDRAYGLLATAPPDEVATPRGRLRVIARHSCVYADRRFGHVVMEYRGTVVSLLMSMRVDSFAPATDDALPHLVGQSRNGISVVSVNGSRHTIMLVGNLDSGELSELSKILSVPLARQLETSFGSPDRTILTQLTGTQPVLPRPRLVSSIAAVGLD